MKPLTAEEIDSLNKEYLQPLVDHSEVLFMI